MGCAGMPDQPLADDARTGVRAKSRLRTSPDRNSIHGHRIYRPWQHGTADGTSAHRGRPQARRLRHAQRRGRSLGRNGSPACVIACRCRRPRRDRHGESPLAANLRKSRDRRRRCHSRQAHQALHRSVDHRLAGCGKGRGCAGEEKHLADRTHRSAAASVVQRRERWRLWSRGRRPKSIW